MNQNIAETGIPDGESEIIAEIQEMDGYPCPECGVKMENKVVKGDPYRGVGQYDCPSCSYIMKNTHKVETGEIYGIESNSSLKFGKGEEK